MTPDDHPPRPADPGAEPPLERQDEQASALVDGLLDDARAADARRSPDVAARAAAMEAARTSLRNVPPADPSARDRAMAAALAAFDEDVEGAVGQAHAAPTGPRPSVADIGAHRRRRDGTGRWLGAAAAAVLLVGVLIAGLVSSSSSDQDTSDSATAALDTTEPAPGGDAEESSESAPDEDAGGGEVTGDASAEAPSSGSAAARAVLGSFPDAEALLDAAAAAPGAQAGAAGQDESIAPAYGALAVRCPGGLPEPFTASGDGAAIVASGEVDGVTVEVWRTGSGDAARLVALDPACAVLAERPLA